jgi:hypothetical protein
MSVRKVGSAATRCLFSEVLISCSVRPASAPVRHIWVAGLPGRTTLIPVGPGLEMLVPAHLPVPILRAVIAKSGASLSCDSVTLVTYPPRSGSYLRDPGQWVMLVPEPHEFAKVHDRVADAA